MQGIALVKWVKGMQNEMVKVLMLKVLHTTFPTFQWGSVLLAMCPQFTSRFTDWIYDRENYVTFPDAFTLFSFDMHEFGMPHHPIDQLAMAYHLGMSSDI
mgnify:CR=1 FL=1